MKPWCKATYFPSRESRDSRGCCFPTGFPSFANIRHHTQVTDARVQNRSRKWTAYAAETFETSASTFRRRLAMPFIVQNNTFMLLGKQRTQRSPKAIDTPAKCHRISVVTVYTHLVLQKAVARDAVHSQCMEIKPRHAGTALIPAQHQERKVAASHRCGQLDRGYCLSSLGGKCE